MASAELDELIVADAEALRAWLSANHAKSPGVWLALTKKGGIVTTLTWQQAVDEALCFGWIDGQTRKRDQETSWIRFTPRRPRSSWSQRNIAHVARLEAQGRMLPPGRAAVVAAPFPSDGGERLRDGSVRKDHAGPNVAAVEVGSGQFGKYDVPLVVRILERIDVYRESVGVLRPARVTPYWPACEHGGGVVVPGRRCVELGGAGHPHPLDRVPLREQPPEHLDQAVGRTRIEEQLTGVRQPVEPAEADRHVTQVRGFHRAGACPGGAGEHARRYGLDRGVEAAVGRGR